MSQEVNENTSAEPEGQQPETTSIDYLLERKGGMPGEQGILLEPVGSHHTDPFAAQDDSPAAANQPSSAVSTPQSTDSSDSPITGSVETQGSAESN
jgi:hypothetical protein